ncbi:MAG: AMP-binding protein [Rhodobacterales bacterium]|nr:AMP-binding protein [Rhodobacterales bacterium]
MNLALWLQRTATDHPDRPALFLGRDQIATYGEFYHRAAQIAAEILARGAVPGDRIAIYLKNCPDYLIIQYGIWLAGLAVVPINAKLHAREVAFIIQNAGTLMCFTDQDMEDPLLIAGVTGDVIEVPSDAYQAMFDNVPLADPVARGDDDLAWLFYTSGTTGKPKGVIITHGMLTAMTDAYMIDADTASAEDAVLYAAPMSHGAGIYNMLHVRIGARHICPPSGGFDAVEIFDLARHFGRVQLFAAPTMVKRMTAVAKSTGETGAGLRSVVYAGGPMYVADIIEAVDHFGDIFIQIYGQGECPMSITALSRQDVSDRSHPRWRERLGSVGRAQSVVEVRIGDDGGAPLPNGESGEIMVRGQTVMPGYWKNPRATAKTVVDGWLRTGDVGVMDDDGYVTLQDRSKDMIISGGSNIYPREVEEVLLTHDTVIEASVVGRPNAEWGEDVVAFVVTEGALDRAALDAHCLDQIARFKRPKTYYPLKELPKNNYGKVLKTTLRKLLKDMK